MPWSTDHKQATRERIVEAASKAFRSRGMEAVGIAELMKAAGLTHGGFYAHFGSKDELAAEAVAHAAAQTRQRLSVVAAKVAPGKRLLAAVEAYLSGRHCRHAEWGCPVAALGAEMTRGEGPAQVAFGDAVRDFLAWLEAQSDEWPRSERRRRAAGVLATMVGAVTVARAFGDGDESDEYLAQVRQFLRTSLERA